MEKAHNFVIALLRHADYRQPAGVPSAMLPYSLTDEGRAQARRAGQVIADFSSKHGIPVAARIDSSHMRRAWETANLIGESLLESVNLDFRIDEFDALAERSVGAAANLTVDEIEQLLADDPRYETPPANWKSDSDYQLPFQGAESLRTAGSRVASHIESVLERGGREHSLKIIVGHGASIRHAAMHLGILSKDEVGQLSMYHAVPIFLAYDGMRLKRVEGEWKVRRSAGDSDEIANG